MPPYGAIDIADNWGDIVADAQTSQKSRINAIEQLLARSGAAGDVIGALSVVTEVKHHVARVARVSDEAILASNLRDTPEHLREVASGVLFHSPIGLQINASSNQKYDRVFVAWDSSEAASAAVHVALPYLKAASEVIIGSIDPVMTAERDGQDPGTDLAAWLSHHGCAVTVSQFPSGGRAIDTCIRDRADEVGADIVVMGAYGHARMVQALLGGTTRSMMEQTDLAVLMAH